MSTVQVKYNDPLDACIPIQITADRVPDIFERVMRAGNYSDEFIAAELAYARAHDTRTRYTYQEPTLPVPTYDYQVPKRDESNAFDLDAFRYLYRDEESGQIPDKVQQSSDVEETIARTLFWSHVPATNAHRARVRVQRIIRSVRHWWNT